ncbi:DNA utilization protein GntX [Candidatus Pantoea deserta]|uniref:DNA utilization protein GntX n=1 Tax=Candidatus Pantoea deserta TaxID=1869313 RepID=A0A3N4P9M6_9GAMM|nr:DNA utilization protein GntX [Pantoea deserta]RPE01437.1 DNA utilization protein GntX [Pantoea deserta]
MLPMPALCWLCRLPLRIAAHGLCSVCLRALPPLPVLCPRCGLPAGSAEVACGRCLGAPPRWQALVCVSGYHPPLRRWVHQLKFYRITALRVMLARLLLLSWLDARRTRGLVRPDLLLSVPLHKIRACQRGYNQAALLAQPLARWLGCDGPDGVRRSRHATPQHRLDASQRRRSVRGAFRLEIAVRGRHIALIDDVVTTGSTVGEISRIFLAQGAASVQIWCLCRTL